MKILNTIAKHAKATKSAKKANAICLLRVFLRSFAPFVFLPLASCQMAAQPASQPTSKIDLAGGKPAFEAPKGNFSVQLPVDWKKIDKGGDFVLALVPRKSAGGDEDPILAVQYPDLPPHIPGFLPLGGVADGYVNDLKKRFPDQKVDERSNAMLDGANARHVISSFQKDGKPFREVALLAVHGDHVYVITVTCTAAAFDQSQAAFDQLTSSWKWKS